MPRHRDSRIDLPKRSLNPADQMGCKLSPPSARPVLGYFRKAEESIDDLFLWRFDDRTHLIPDRLIPSPAQPLEESTKDFLGPDTSRFI